MQFTIKALHTLLNVPRFADRIDFVNLTKKSIDTLFVTPAIIKKVGGPGNLLFLPKNHWRTIGQIPGWFVLGNGQPHNLVTT